MPATILPSCQVQKESAKAKPMPTTKPAKLPKATGQRRLKHHGEPVSTAEAEVKVDEVLKTLPKMKTKELRKLGEAILGELSSRAALPVRTEL
ncbi:unnamed protein product [Cladocopium goreaui]|uniref:Uncharacterized protein n=1 Tax=Cladocopium goreaui TaxID=2562237 RepID=A0A9P1DF16_9DINO|nr:unnamed protein product [Cladocopium goreaui]